MKLVGDGQKYFVYCRTSFLCWLKPQTANFTVLKGRVTCPMKMSIDDDLDNKQRRSMAIQKTQTYC